MSTFAKGEDPDEIQHSAAFHYGPHCKGKNDLWTKVENYNMTPLDMYN